MPLLTRVGYATGTLVCSWLLCAKVPRQRAPPASFMAHPSALSFLLLQGCFNKKVSEGELSRNGFLLLVSWMMGIMFALPLPFTH